MALCHSNDDSRADVTYFILIPCTIVCSDQMKVKRKQMKKEGKPTVIPEDDNNNVSELSFPYLVFGDETDQ